MKQTKIQMVVTDLDGTLLSENNEICPAAVAMIAGLEERGVRFTFITGRPPYGARRFAQQVKMTAPVVACNGAVIVDQGSFQIIDSRELSLAPLEMLLKEAASQGMTVLVLAGEIEYALSETSWTKTRKAAGRHVPLISLPALLETQQPIYKVNIVAGDQHGFPALLSQIHAQQKNYAVSLYGTSGCEMVAKGVNKETGLRALCQVCGVPIEQVLAIGDNTNDNQMLRAAGIGAAVANGVAETKGCADYVCEQERTSGVIEAIERFVHGKEKP